MPTMMTPFQSLHDCRPIWKTAGLLLIAIAVAGIIFATDGTQWSIAPILLSKPGVTVLGFSIIAVMARVHTIQDCPDRS